MYPFRSRGGKYESFQSLRFEKIWHFWFIYAYWGDLNNFYKFQTWKAGRFATPLARWMNNISFESPYRYSIWSFLFKSVTVLLRWAVLVQSTSILLQKCLFGFLVGPNCMFILIILWSQTSCTGIKPAAVVVLFLNFPYSHFLIELPVSWLACSYYYKLPLLWRNWPGIWGYYCACSQFSLVNQSTVYKRIWK